MIGYISLGTNDVERSAVFYEALLGEMGATRAYCTDKLVAWRFSKGAALFVINTPYDEASASAGNGTMVALNVGDVGEVDRLHALALALGASDEGAPGQRGKGFYAAYFRDADGNKLNLHCHVQADVQVEL